MANPTERPQIDLSGWMPTHGTVSTEIPTKWEDALAAGNGIMGGLLYGSPTNDILIANHCKLWLPRGSREVVPSIGKSLAELRRIIGEEGYPAGQNYFFQAAEDNGWDGKLIWTDAYHPGFFLHVDQPPTGSITDILRIEDFSAGEVWSQWRTDVGEFTRRMFVSKTDNVIVVTTRGPAGQVSLKVAMQEVDNDLIQSQIVCRAGEIRMHNTYVEGKGGFDAYVRVVVDGGVESFDADGISVIGADSVTLITRILPWRTPLEGSEAWPNSLKNPDFSSPQLPGASETVQVAGKEYDPGWMTALANSLSHLTPVYDDLFKTHTAVWRGIFDRVSIDLDGEADERAMSSERLLDLAQKEHRLPTALLERMYDAGRYVYMCSAGPQTPPNLYGIWTGTWHPEWSGDYTTDTNLQLDIECAYSCNMADLMDGYFNLWDQYLPDFKRNALELYGCRGILVGSRSSNNGLALHWGREWPGNMWTPGAAWMAHWHYDHFLYTGDSTFLRDRAIPFMEQAALFWEDFLTGFEDEDGRFRFRPSYSAENDWGDNASQDIQIVTELLENLIEGCELLEIKAPDVQRWRSMLSKMPPLLVNDEGQLQEFAVPGRADYNDHRHMMHLYWAFDAPRFSLDHDPHLYAGAQQALLNRIRYTTTQTSSTHGRMHIALSALHLGLPNLAWTRLTMMAADRSMYSNLVTSHEPGPHIFCDDGNGAIPEVVNRMVLQSNFGALFLLPAVPDSLPKGSVSGLKTRGQIDVTKLDWDMRKGKLSAFLRSEIDQTVEVILPLDVTVDRLSVDGDAKPVTEMRIRKYGSHVLLPARENVAVEVLFHYE